MDAKTMLTKKALSQYVFYQNQDQRTLGEMKRSKEVCEYIPTLNFIVDSQIASIENSLTMTWNIKQLALFNVFDAMFAKATENDKQLFQVV